jgi:hypothetical protein
MDLSGIELPMIEIDVIPATCGYVNSLVKMSFRPELLRILKILLRIHFNVTAGCVHMYHLRA